MTLRGRMSLVFGLLIAFITAFMVLFFPSRMEEQARLSTEQRARAVTAVMATASAPALEFDDPDNASRILGWLGSTPDMRFAVIVTAQNTRFASWGVGIPDELEAMMTDDLLITSAPVVGRGGMRGELYIGQSLEQLIATRDDARRTALVSAVIVLVLGLSVCMVLATALVGPLARVTSLAGEIARGEKPPRIAAVTGMREVVALTSALGTMLERLNAANQQLVDASRHAGMAEVATGVLHNVGNILNSVNVGIELLDERVAALPIERVRRAAALLGTQPTSDAPRLAAGVAYLTAIADRCETEASQLSGELVTLRNHVGHIKRVIAMQNGYARTSGLEEACQIASLVNEAVALGCPDPQRQRIEIVREVVACTVRLDRHRLLQILVNLIANARDAVTGRPTARISVTTLTDGDHLEIRVTDTGVGIAADAIQRVFSAGFTTKPNGHGYGLHSSALSAKHLGGVLSCASPGVGGGATFTVRIPVRKGSHDAA